MNLLGLGWSCHRFLCPTLPLQWCQKKGIRIKIWKALKLKRWPFSVTTHAGYNEVYRVYSREFPHNCCNSIYGDTYSSGIFSLSHQDMEFMLPPFHLVQVFVIALKTEDSKSSTVSLLRLGHKSQYSFYLLFLGFHIFGTISHSVRSPGTLKHLMERAHRDRGRYMRSPSSPATAIRVSTS